jgi:hypothetical protein
MDYYSEIFNKSWVSDKHAFYFFAQDAGSYYGSKVMIQAHPELLEDYRIEGDKVFVGTALVYTILTIDRQHPAYMELMNGQGERERFEELNFGGMPAGKNLDLLG